MFQENNLLLTKRGVHKYCGSSRKFMLLDIIQHPSAQNIFFLDKPFGNPYDAYKKQIFSPN